MSSQHSTQKIAVIVLAAGSSSRLGKPKQLLHYQQETLIKRTVKTALQLTAENVFVVSGFLHRELIDELQDLPIQILHNPNWAEGMGSSIQTGISAVLKSAQANQLLAVLILLSDQPLITSSYLNKLIDEFYLHKNSMIAATAYAGTQGVPAVFGKDFFGDLKQLTGKSGAKEIFKKYQNQVITVANEDAKVDIDTEQDYAELLKST